ncbi:hypothetical protein DFH08DRAFT_821858 [Mycena albidolilacea]|uniref:Uncharacterized protein n=1 Tax=Mycena albidolilacea TaxID=1033008 RepID=A0AAD6Z9B3_9AGAR|nr:hypothetical protein DFH08DRAFT_821858 [Mycena albidolilacea]
MPLCLGHALSIAIAGARSLITADISINNGAPSSAKTAPSTVLAPSRLRPSFALAIFTPYLGTQCHIQNHYYYLWSSLFSTMLNNSTSVLAVIDDAKSISGKLFCTNGGFIAVADLYKSLNMSARGCRRCPDHQYLPKRVAMLRFCD